MPRRTALLLALCLLPAAASAEPEVGDRLAPLRVEDCGEMELAGDAIAYRPWDPRGGPVLVHFMAARLGVEKLNGPVVRQILRRRPALRPSVVTLVNAEDAVWGTGGFVRASVERRKRELPRARMVLDCAGAVAEAWGLPAATSGLLLLDAEGTVRFVQVGPLPGERLPELLAEVDALWLPEDAPSAQADARAP